MRKIKLTRGKYALVDDEDYDRLNKYKWYAAKTTNTFYACRTTFINGKRTQLGIHRQALNNYDFSVMIDHEDNNGLNNQKCNLRACTHAQNIRNVKKYKCKNKKSKYKGVTIRKYRIGKWKAKICVNGIIIELGCHRNEKDAALAYNKAAIKYHGEFAKLNEI